MLHVVEPFDHIEVVHRWLPIFEGMSIANVTCHLSPRYRDEFLGLYPHLTNVRISGPPEKVSWAQYLQGLQLGPADKIILATIGAKPHWFNSLIGSVEYFLIIHNVNSAFSSRQNLSTGCNPIYLLRQSLRMARRPYHEALLRGASGLIFPSAELARTAHARADNSMPPFHTIPFAFRGEYQVTQITETRPLRLVLPGTVSHNTRDLELILRVIKMLPPTPSAIVIHLAGKIRDKQIITALRQICPVHTGRANEATSNVSVFIYPEGLSHVHYQELLQQADIIWAPLCRRVRSGNYWEVMGQTKISGSVYDAIYANKPLLIPAWYRIEDNPAIIRYRGLEDILDTLTNWQSEDHPAAIRWCEYSKTTVANALQQLLERS